jgi:hypothetical protein
VHRNRRRIRGPRGQRLLRLRGERLERPFAHLYETGGMRRVYLRGHANIRKRLLIHSAGFNLGLLMRRLIGVGTPRGCGPAERGTLLTLIRALWQLRPVLVVPAPLFSTRSCLIARCDSPPWAQRNPLSPRAASSLEGYRSRPMASSVSQMADGGTKSPPLCAARRAHRDRRPAGRPPSPRVPATQ